MPITESFNFFKLKHESQELLMSFCVLFWTLKFENEIFSRQQSSGSFKHITQRHNGHQQKWSLSLWPQHDKNHRGILFDCDGFLSFSHYYKSCFLCTFPHLKAKRVIIPKVAFVFTLAPRASWTFSPPSMELCYKKVKDLRLASYDLFCLNLTL